jgi:hypothetical protein
MLRIGLSVHSRIEEIPHMPHRSVWFASAVVLALSSLLPGCKPKPGDKCQGSSSRCADKTSALACVNAVLTTVSCRGAKGCTSSANTMDCDNSLANVGEGCVIQGDVSCAADKKAALDCDQNKFRVAETCKGIKGCEVKADNQIACDNDIADVGDACHRNGDFACAVDKKAVLKCADKKFGSITTCRGPKGCRVMELPEEKRIEFSCDDTVAQESDPCEHNGEYACSVDGKSIYTCKSNKYAPAKACPGGCTYDEHEGSLSCLEGGGAKTVLAKASLRTGKGSAGGGAPPATAGSAVTPPAAALASASPKPATSGAPPGKVGAKPAPAPKKKK